MAIIQSTYLLAYGFVFYIFVQSIGIARSFSLAYKQNEELTEKLDYQNKNLEKIVKERTSEIMIQKEEIQSQKEELEVYNEKMYAQNLEIQEKNNEITIQKDILEKSNKQITSSITYARRIQQAIFPSENWLDTTLPEYFVIWKPKDIVSGDFFWLKVIGKFTVVAAADSTGHGVPGAFMSMLGISILNDIVTYRNAKIPGQVLNEMRHAVKKLLNQKGVSWEQKDGFDISFCSIDNVEIKLYFSGANLPIYIFRDKQLTEFKAIRNPISIYLNEKQFETHEYKLDKNDIIYLFSDGIIDQIGGETNDKFKARRLKKLLSEICDQNLKKQKEIIESTIDNWMNNNNVYSQIDDILVLGIKI
jgi:serine phosphatase RsbU (regulator of sigma subunit)